jgi:hypothetical protein
LQIPNYQSSKGRSLPHHREDVRTNALRDLRRNAHPTGASPRGKPGVDDIVDDSIVREIEKEGFIDRLYR